MIRMEQLRAIPLSPSCSRSFAVRPLPVESIVYASESLRIGAFRCPAEHLLFEDSGPIDNDIFVFPRRAVMIEHEHREPFVADPLLVTLYNRGQRYRRKPVGGQPDLCDWFALAPSILEEVSQEPSTNGPFSRAFVRSSREIYLRQRRLYTLARLGILDDLEAVEEATAILSTLLESSQPHRQAERDSRLASAARARIAERYTRNDSLASIANAVNASQWHLARTFRRVFGVSMGQYREELRMRAAIARLDGTKLTDVALDLGYSSHAHFTYRFRKAFGVAPAAARALLAGGQSPESTSKASAIIRGGAQRWRYSHTARISSS